MITRLFPDKVENPVRDHIQMSFDVLIDAKDMCGKIAEDLIELNFDPDKSRVLIFSPTRKGAEEAVNELKSELESYGASYSDKVDYYHAGLDGISREEKYEDYKDGKLVILIATKAFGMGMDIKNIHFVFHLGPSSTFEDYLQEVGRAGRDPKKLLEAGFSKVNPLQSKCLLTRNDFKKLKDRNHKNQITWNQVDKVRLSIFEYYSKFRELKPDIENAFPLPLDLLNQFSEYEDIFDRDTFFRVVLYWLEKLDRIKLGVYTPTFLPIRLLKEEANFSWIKTAEERDVIISLGNFLKNFKLDKFPNSEILMIDMTALREQLKVKSSYEIFKFLFKAQKAKVLVVERFITIQPTKNRTEELKKWNSRTKSPRIEATFDFAEDLIDLSKPGDQISLEDSEIEQLFSEKILKHFEHSRIFWNEVKNEKKNVFYTNEEIAEKLKGDFDKKRSKFAYKVLSFLEKIRHKSILETDSHTKRPIVTQLLYNGYKSKEEPKEYTQYFKRDLYKLILHIYKTYIKKDKKKFNIVDLINELDLTDKSEDYFQNLVFISKGLGYLKGGGSLLPMGIEMRITDVSEIQGDTIGTSDYRIKQEFVESTKMKELRLLALECLSDISKARYDDYIKGYFKCGSIEELISLLEDYIGENDERLKGFREEALNKEKERLNSSQEKVYESDIRRNIQVAAGPGSGKTHTLTLRVARLIQEEKVRPETILILAYNRSVVVELKDRLRTLFKDLGYSRLISRLKVFTFHGFIKYCLGSKIQDLGFHEWTPKFINVMETAPGEITQKLGSVKYVFVDEFQDITTERMQLLKMIANPERVKVCVIGDPNQSIYGYERADAGDSMDPKPYYEEFKRTYKPLERNLEINYRSYPKILTVAKNLLSLNQSRYPLPDLKAKRQPVTTHNYCEIIDVSKTKIIWKEKLKELIKFESQGNKYTQIAVMFRSNNEVFRAFNEIKNLNIPDVRIRIQGSGGTLFKSREFYYLIFVLNKKENSVLTDKFLDEIKTLKFKTVSKFPRWDKYLLNIFHCLAFEYNKERDENSTYLDFILFVKDIASNDDGQYGKIYQQNISQITNEGTKDQEIVITTMHKVKGLEFDAVLIPPSFTDLPAFENSATLQENTEEERRLYYVAYTRARYRLVVFLFQRENAMLAGDKYTIPDSQKLRLGIPFRGGWDKFTMFWSASDYGYNSFEILKDSVSIGDQLVLQLESRGGYSFWYVLIGNRKVAQLSIQMKNYINNFYYNQHLNIPHRIEGFSVSSIEVHSYEETVESDSNNNTKFATRWNSNARNRGYIYLLDFSGYGKPITI